MVHKLCKLIEIIKVILDKLIKKNKRIDCDIEYLNAFVCFLYVSGRLHGS